MAKQSTDRKAVILHAARKMVATQMTVASAEAEAMAYIEKRLADPSTKAAGA